jgi:hypothetical protein
MNMELSTRDRSRLLAGAILLAVFAAGAFGGAALTIAFRSNPHGLRHEERVLVGPHGGALPGDPGGMVYLRTREPLDAELGLDDEQRERVQLLMEEQARKAEQLMTDMEPRMKALMDSTNAAIEAVLTPEQRERFQRMREERRDMMVRRFEYAVPGPGGGMRMRVPAPPPEPAEPPE